MGFFSSILLFLGIIAGFFAPGFLINRLLMRENSIATAFIISMVVLFHLIFWTGLAGVPLSLISIGLGLLLVICALSLAVYNMGIGLKLDTLEDAICFTTSQKILLIPVALNIFLMFLKSSVFQISHGDQDFRWFFLPTQMLELGTFAFYPPLTAADFDIYFFTDSFPPIVSFSYFLLYALYGSARDFLVFIPVSMQFIFILTFGWKLAMRLFPSKDAGPFAVMLLSSSTLLFYSVAICQETGLTALSLLALVYFLHDERPDWRSAILASFSTALGALSREYGGILLICGITAITVRKMPLKFLVQYFLFCTILIAPWYLRVFILTGNPFYSNPIMGLPVNEVHTGIIEGYKQSIGLHTYMNANVILPFISGLISVAGAVVVLGTISFFLEPRNRLMPIITLYFFLLWLYSIWIPAGLFHSMRILSPAIAICAVSGTGAFLWLSHKTRMRATHQYSLLAIMASVAVLQDVIIPYSPRLIGKFPLSVLSGMVNIEHPHPRDEVRSYAEKLPAGSAILSDGARHHAFLSTDKEIVEKIRIVALWSPEVAFLYDKNMNFEEANRRLKTLGIRYVLTGHRGSLNMRYLEKFEFFREFRSRSKPIVDDKLVGLPDVQESF